MHSPLPTEINVEYLHFLQDFQKYVLTEKGVWTKIYEYVCIKRPCPILMKQIIKKRMFGGVHIG